MEQNHSKCCQEFDAEDGGDEFVCANLLQDFGCVEQEQCVYDCADDIQCGDLSFGEKSREVCRVYVNDERVVERDENVRQKQCVE